MIVIRHGLMLVGLSFGMKTSAIRVLAAALTQMSTTAGSEHKVKVGAIRVLCGTWLALRVCFQF